ncbi:NAD(P)-dependent dehydrogenase, short-chain alcohol dehydrogenase family [Dyadobacter sp. SG02]|uniref:SDR family NAD(P)-dependent oxidoreductase n=1 Tax=Dyadobacter sp. SG02 TaxID=1855291 RepID=UPI0008C16661|nr:SDR family NAD(P)-dependent oxidoreductase [Dyadobacter sp. SG02]SEJ49859.1 NAD(P)-dependent dehydrogenase, short-chain alcohol dehydrogenase family [Dyadobacter sp. SG02]
MDLKLKQKTAFISGSTQGIGFAIARQLLEEGANVIVNGRSEEKTTGAVKRLLETDPAGNVTGIAADFSKPEDVARLIASLPEVDILINNVGIFELKPFSEIDEADWLRVFQVNVMSGARLSKAILPGMLERKWGRVVFISSESGVNVPADMIHYGVTKTAMLSLANGLSKLTKGTEVTVNSILGGPTYSDGVAGTVEAIAGAQGMDVEQMKAAILGSTNPQSLLQRFIRPEEIAGLVAYLCSPLAVATNGSSLRADGGVLQVL